MKSPKQYKDSETQIQELKDIIQQFVVERKWLQFHTPKNLSMSIAIEAGELMEKFQFVESEESFQIVKEHKEEVAHELVDVLAYICSFANVCEIDLAYYFTQKMGLNRKKYPVELAQGDYGKYTKLKKG